MCLEKKDLRLKLDPDLHRALDVLATCDDLDLGELGAQIIKEYVCRRVHAATVIAAKTANLGISGNRGEFPGTPGNRGETAGFKAPR